MMRGRDKGRCNAAAAALLLRCCCAAVLLLLHTPTQQRELHGKQHPSSRSAADPQPIRSPITD